MKTHQLLQANGWMNGWMEWLDGWNGWMNGMDGWMERKLKYMSLRSNKYALQCKIYLSYFIKAIK
jgi:hypothetical protein